MIKESELIELLQEYYSQRPFTEPCSLLKKLKWRDLELNKHSSGVYRYIKNGEIIYIGMSEKSVFRRTSSFVRHVGICLEGKRGNESHSRRWVRLGYTLADLEDVIVEYSLCDRLFARSYEAWLIDKHIAKHGQPPLLNMAK
tara:strand:- start:280 stop:705 length:426 start_codon:yes stop_codon:yes gene_type:complete